jgi:hypothetical protein
MADDHFKNDSHEDHRHQSDFLCTAFEFEVKLQIISEGNSASHPQGAIGKADNSNQKWIETY